MRPISLLLSLVSVVLALNMSGCQRNPVDALSDAKARLERKDETGAEIVLKNILQNNPDAAEARFLWGLQMQKRGEHSSALIELQRARALKYDNQLVVPAIVKSLLAQGKFKQIIEEYENFELANPEAKAELQSLVAQALNAEGNKQAANDLITKAGVAAPASESVLLVKARFAAQAGSFTQAMALLDELISKKPTSHLAWTMKGHVLGAQIDKREAAADAYRKALAIQPEDVAARTGLIALSMMARDFTAAAQELTALQKVAPKHPNTVFYEANLAYAKGNYTEARTLYQSVLQVAPNQPAALLGAAENELRLNATGQAEKMAAKALANAPDSPRAKQVLAQVYLRTGQPAKVIASLASLVDSPQAPAEILALAAQGHLMNGNANAADQLYTRMAKLNPSDPALRTMLATASMNKSGSDQATDLLQRISDEDKGTTADLALISARLKARQFDAALKAVEVLIKKQPEQAMGYQLKAQVLAHSNDLAGARQALEMAVAKEATYLPAVLGLATLEMRDKKPQLAKARIEELIKKQPANAQAMVALAELGIEAGMPPDVVLGHLERAVAIDRTDIAIWAALIDQQAKYGNLPAALTSSQSAVAANPDSIQLLDRLGRVQALSGQMEQALSTFRQLTKQHPRSLVGLLGEAEVLIATGKVAEAGRAVNKVLEGDPQNLAALNLAFGSALQQKQYKAATEVARTVQQLRPTFAAGTLMEAEVEDQQGRTDSAQLLWRKALRLSAPGNAPVKLHRALLQTGKVSDAQVFETAWLKDYPGDVNFMVHLATLARLEGRTDLAEQRFREVLGKQPNHAAALNDLAMMLAQQGKAEAVPLAERALKQSPSNPALIDTLAHAFAATKLWPQAVENQKRAVSLAPNDPSLRLALAQFEFQSGDTTAARRSLNTVLGNASKLSADDKATMAKLAKALNPG